MARRGSLGNFSIFDMQLSRRMFRQLGHLRLAVKRYMLANS
jgi:hypothetical protein